MKKVLSVLCMAILAGGLIFTSCTKKQFTITVKANNDAWGTVIGGGTFEDGATATLTATANEGYEFEKWQDGSKENPRTITVTADETYTAFFKEKEQPTPPTPTNGVSVTFSSDSWTAGQISGAYYADYGAWDIYSCKTTSDEYPKADCCAYAAATGQYSDATSDGENYDNNVVAWIEYYESTTLTDGTNPYGDWWAKSANINVSAFDATAMTMSANVNATMFDAYTAFVDGAGFASAPTTSMIVNMNGVDMNAAKSGMKKISTKLHVK